MRICPCCKTKDLLIWRHLQHGRYTDYCHIEELRDWNKELAVKVEASPKFYFDGLFNYKLLSSGFVHRIWVEDAKTPNSVSEPDMEKPKNRVCLEYRVFRPYLPEKKVIAVKLRSLLKGHEDKLNISFGVGKWEHWLRMDSRGFHYPSKTDWLEVKKIVQTSPDTDLWFLTEITEIQSRLDFISSETKNTEAIQ
jgi:hypothetical protein